MKKNKLTIEKFKILSFNNLSKIVGGTSFGSGGTYTIDSRHGSFTTNPEVPCPETVWSDSSPILNDSTGTSGDDTTGEDDVPTFNKGLVPEP